MNKHSAKKYAKFVFNLFLYQPLSMRISYKFYEKSQVIFFRHIIMRNNCKAKQFLALSQTNIKENPTKITQFRNEDDSI